MTDFTQLRAFVTVGETLSFSKAARELGVSASALSQLIRGLEGRVGVRLFNRSTRSVALTEAGRALFDEVAPAVAKVDGAVERARRAGERPAGTVRVHCFRTAAERFVKPMLATFLADYPDVTVDVTLDDTVIDMVAGGYDVAIRIGEVIEKDMVAVRLGEDLRQVVVASPSYLAAHGAPKSPRDVHAHRCICWRWPGEVRPYAWEFFEDGDWFAIAVKGPVIVNDKQFQIDAALAGIGLAFVVEQYVAEHIAAGRLIPLLTKWSASFPGMFACYPERRQMAPAVRAFIDALKRSAHARSEG
jgi:DNA-binding transcriptional LysR family regulator